MHAEGLMVADDPKRFRNSLQVIGTIVAILAAVVPGVVWAVDRLGDDKPAASGPSPSSGQPDVPAAGGATTRNAATGAPAVVSSTPAAATNKVFLDSLTPDTGTTNLGPLPRTLSGRPGYEHPVTLPCGSNNTGDKSRTVSYLLERRYVNLTAEVRSYKEKADEYKVDLRFFADNQQPQVVQIGVNEQQPFTMSVDGVKKLTLELTCERPGALVTLTNAWLEHA